MNSGRVAAIAECADFRQSRFIAPPNGLRMSCGPTPNRTPWSRPATATRAHPDRAADHAQFVALLTDMIVNYRQEQHLARTRAAASQADAHPPEEPPGQNPAHDPSSSYAVISAPPGVTRKPHRSTRATARYSEATGKFGSRPNEWLSLRPLSIDRSRYRHLPNDFRVPAREKTQPGTVASASVERAPDRTDDAGTAPRIRPDSHLHDHRSRYARSYSSRHHDLAQGNGTGRRRLKGGLSAPPPEQSSSAKSTAMPYRAMARRASITTAGRAKAESLPWTA
jgi:hypothetical protein